MNELEVQLRGCSVRQLIVAMRLMRSDKDTIGFDYSKIRKDELIDRAIVMADSLSADRRDKAYRMMVKAFGWKAADVTGKASAVGGSGSGTDAKSTKLKGLAALEEAARGYGKTSAERHGPDQGGSSNDGDSKESKQKFEEMAREAVEDAARKAAPEAVKEAVAEAMEKQTDELMERLSKTIFKVEIESDDDDAKGKKKTRTIEAGTPRHEVFQEVCQAVNKGLNVLLVGPAGCGKTHMAEDIAKVLALQFKFTGAVSSEYKLLGFMTAQGTVVRTEYREAYEHGGLFLWDELDASSAQALLSFNAGLANGHQDFPDKVVDQHKSFRAIASANTYGNGADRMYIGRNQLDAASLDRFYVVNMDYDEQLECALYGKDKWVTYVQRARRAMRSLGGIRHVISMRAIQMGLKMKGTGVPSSKVEQACLWRHLQADDVAKIKRAMEK